MKRFAVFIVVVTLSTLTVVPTEQAAASDTVTRWEHFSESSNCSDPYTKTPYVSRTGSLADSEKVLGPFGTYFGRTVSDVRSHLVYWTLPFSGGKRLRVHEAALDAFNQVADGLYAEAGQGRVYPITSASTFVSRTISGSYQLSRHSLGLAIDINYPQNPYRSDVKLITNMPGWFVDVWRDAGFCWGGDWRYSKDPMHFSWIGPKAGIEPGLPIEPLPPLTSKKPFGPADFASSTVFAPITERYELMISDGTGDGAPDIVGLRPHPDGAVLDIGSSNEGFGECSVRRWFLSDSLFVGASGTLLMDVNGDSRQDLLVLVPSGSTYTARVATQREEFEATTIRDTAISTEAHVFAGGDFNGDHLADIFAARDDGSISVYAGPDWVNTLDVGSLPSGMPTSMTAADRDGGDTPELFAVYDNGGLARLEILTLAGDWELEQSLPLPIQMGEIEAVGAGDFDGDGRADFMILDQDGRLQAHLGNTSTGRPSDGWFTRPNPPCDEVIPLYFEGRFYDDDSSVHQNGIEFIVSRNITVGCNPPFWDEYCPADHLTRAQAATFMSRAIGLPPPMADHFIDDNGHVLEGAINRVAEAGISQGCNPPANSRFCPDRDMTRAEFAAFMVRSLNLPVATTDYFTDDDGLVLEGAINRLAAAGITQGCNPPANEHFCPNDYLTRAEAATFLTRALK